MSLDQIALRGLRVFGYHGVLDSERRDGQEFAIDAVLWLDTSASRSASVSMSRTGGPLVREVEITVHKPHAPVGHPFEDVAVSIRRPRP